jgi:CMP/dCMP kinase
MLKSLIIACDGEAASGKSTGAKLVSKKYDLLLINTGLFYRYASKLVLDNQPKKVVPFIKKKFKNITYQKVASQNLFSQNISKYVGILSKKKKIRLIIEDIQKKIIKKNKRICLEGRDIASNILKKNPKYDVAFYFKCKLDIASKRRWLDLKKKVSLKEVKKTLRKRTLLDKKRTHNPLIKVKDAVLIRSDMLSKTQMLNKMSFEIDKKFKTKF